MRVRLEWLRDVAGTAVAVGVFLAAAVSGGCEGREPAAPGGGGSGTTTPGQGGVAGSGGTGGETTAMGGGTSTATGGTSTAAGGMGGAGGVGAGGMAPGGMGGTGGIGTGGSGMGGAGGGMVAEMVPDFSLLDHNPNSMTYSTPVSPRDHLGRVSAWYFGHST